MKEEGGKNGAVEMEKGVSCSGNTKGGRRLSRDEQFEFGQREGCFVGGRADACSQSRLSLCWREASPEEKSLLLLLLYTAGAVHLGQCVIADLTLNISLQSCKVPSAQCVG